MTAANVKRFRLGLGSVGMLCLLASSLPWLGLTNVSRAALVLAGISLLTASIALAPRRLAAPGFIGGLFVLLGGLSALYAATDAPSGASPRAFAYAAFVTGLAASAAIGAAWLCGRFLGIGPRRSDETDLDHVERAGQILVAAGFVGLALALIRFAIVELPSDDPWRSMKSFWRGSSYLLLVANAAVPGFALWLSAALRRESRRSLFLVCGVAGLYLLAYAPTGQRGAVAQVGLVGVAVFVGARRVRAARLMIVLLSAALLAGVTQAVRNEIREFRSFSPHRVVERLSPDQWGVLYGSQIASFHWTWDVAAHRDDLEIPNTFLHALLKPVPRQLLPGKVQGFGEEFTERLYPDAYAEQVSFATPLTAEADYNGGVPGVLVIFLVLGFGAAFAEIHLVRRAPSLLAPAWAAAVLWTGMVLLRGDLANALVFSSGFVVPLALTSIALGFRPERRSHRLVVDGLQVAVAFSGVGRQLLNLGEGTGRAHLHSALEVRCAEDVLPLLRDSLPRSTRFRVPIRRSRPRGLRILYQQAVAALLDSRSSVLLCLGDQAPIWGRARVVLVVNDMRRLQEAAGSGLESRFYRFIVPRSVRRADRIVTISRFSRDEIHRLLGRELPIEVVAGHGPTPKASAPQLREGGLVLSVGALRPYKGGDTIVRALAGLGEAERPRVAFAGEGGGYEEELKAQVAREGLGSCVQFMGWVSDETLADLYRSCTVAVHASTYEGYGLPLAEGLSYGAPTIASEIPAHLEVAGPAAVYFPAGDAAALATEIRRVLGSETIRLELSQKALARSHELATLRPTWRDVLVSSAALVT